MILLLVLALFAARQFLVPQMDTVAIAPNPPTGVQDESDDDSLATPDAAPAGDVAGEGEPQEAARRIVHVPGNAGDTSEESPDFDSWSVKDEHLEAYAKHNLEKALAGDLGAANRIVRVHKKCLDAPRSLPEVERAVAKADGMRMYVVVPGKDPEVKHPDKSEVWEEEFNRFSACQFWDQLFNMELRTRLERLAESGEVTARYLYAMWPPRVFGQPDAFFVHQAWAENAMNFSLANLADGELAGMLAFGQSYMGSSSFTNRDLYLGYAFLIAAVDCGLALAPITALASGVLNMQVAPPGAEDPVPGMLSMAEGLKGLCMQ